MIGDERPPNDAGSTSDESLARLDLPSADDRIADNDALPGRMVGGRRINFQAWAIVAVVSVVMWLLIFRWM